MITAFMGNDGSGKTTLAKKLEGKLRALGVDV
jgi:thymidylate kinase